MPSQVDIYNKLKKLIYYGDLSPGEKLSEVELTKKLNVSRTPIREAFRQLQMEGYITVLPNKGAYVSKLPPEKIEEIYDIVCLLEGFAAALAAQKVNDSGLNQLNKIQEKLDLSACRKKYRDYIKWNTEFHQWITRLSGNESLAQTIDELRTRIYRYRLISVTIPGYLEKYASDHVRIIQAIGKKDSGRAKKYMEVHIHFVKKILINFLKENRGF
jgi:DNA-binding GntR family transcriptional regulator